ncbi:uncharacterized protein LOC143058117 [Mytilus galloprovincialis]|uniref:uncharacterized protein LOC143058117 n=1 Tax=Mytilus galloprovincialis TaxID=29158 RepID=UPI003F7C4E69
MSEDSSSNEDETNDTITCGPCQQNFTKLVEFTKHIKICSKRKKKATKRNPRKRRLYQMKYTQVGNRWITEVKKKIKREPELLDTEDTYVYHMETSCLIVWAESSQSEKESSDQIKERCIQFTENMFKKCPLDSLETVEVDVTVTFSELFEESDSENDDLFECGICGHVFHTINSFLVHKKNCRRHRKRRRGSKGDDKLVQNSKKIKIDEISQEEENFLRIAVLITRVATDAVRIVFDRELQGGALKGTLIEEPKVLDDLERKRIILPFQWQLIFPKSGQASSYSLNLKIMACLIQVLQTKYVDEKLPTDQNDFSIEADLSRLLYYRRVIARSTDTKLEKEKMDEYWMVISGVIERLGGKGFRHQCNELKVSNFNVNYIEMLTEIKEIAKKDNSYTQGFNSK